MISVVIPTYNEAVVIEEALQRAAAALRTTGEDFELIVVDDASADGTAARAAALAPQVPVRVVRRPGKLGLATAVMDGWAAARGDVLGVMDGDLQHPPEVLAALVQALHREDVDLAIASRYVPGGGSYDWIWVRRFISRTAHHMAATVLPLKVAGVGDTGSGLFMVRAAAVRNVNLKPLGFKVLLEVLAKAHVRSLVELPYTFQKRPRGTSKASAVQFLAYLVHLARLAWETGQVRAWLRYGLVALAGAGIDVLLFKALVGKAAWPPALALPVAIQTALLSNFIWSEVFTFRSSGLKAFGQGALRRLRRYEGICLPGAFLNFLATMAAMALGVNILMAAGAGVVTGGVWNFALNVPAIWRTWRKPA